MPPQVAELLDVRRVAQQDLDLVVQRTLAPRVVLPPAQGVEDLPEGVVAQRGTDEASTLVGEAIRALAMGGLRVGVEDLPDRIATGGSPGKGGRG
jgi:hypothetical protein